jgi:D-threo-aldose 1-dehydrogenase
MSRCGVQVTELGFGGATIGRGLGPAADRDAHATLEACWDLGVRYFDTAPWYGRGLSELRVGRLLRDCPRDEFVLSTKVGRILRAPRLASVAPPAGGLPFEVVFD